VDAGGGCSGECLGFRFWGLGLGLGRGCWWRMLW
jgi:hypothetical protein